MKLMQLNGLIDNYEELCWLFAGVTGPPGNLGSRGALILGRC